MLTDDEGDYELETDPEKLRDLPDGYTQITYLESHGRQRIHTGIAPNITTKIEFSFAYTTDTAFSMGCRYNYYQPQGFYMTVKNDGSFVFKVGYDDINGPTETYKEQIYNVSMSCGDVSVDGVSYGGCRNWQGNISQDFTLYALNIHGGNGGAKIDYTPVPTDTGSLKIYSMKIYSGETLVRDFLPCYSSKYEFGLYDIQNNKFYENDGRGSFNFANDNYSIIGNGTQNNPFQISSAKDLIYLSDLSSNGRIASSINAILTKDVKLNDGYFDDNGIYHDGGDGILYTFKPIVDYTYGSAPIYIDGKGFEISGLYAVPRSNCVGLFTHFGNGTLVQNILIKNSYYNSATYVGGFASHINSGTSMRFDYNATFKNCKISAYMNGGGGLIGVARYITISFENCTINVKGNSSGLVSFVNYANSEQYRTVVFKNCINYSQTSSGYGIAPYGTFENCVNYSNASFGGICNAAPYISNCTNYGKIANGPGIAGTLNSNGEMRDCKNLGATTGAGLVNTINANATVIDCENAYQGKCTSGLVGTCSGKIYRCINQSNATYGLVNTLNATGGIYNCESNANTTYYLGNNLNSGGIIKNCIIRGSASNKKGVANTNNATIQNVIFDGEISGIKSKQYYGTDFSAFFVKWKTGYIGLKALESAGVYMFAIPNETYLQERGFTKVA